MHRIVSLIASSTEIVCALGLADQLVGRSHECDFPAFVKDLPQCTEPKFNCDGTSYAIDQKVRAIVQEGLSVYRVDAAKLDSLAPTHVITQTQCEVCAVSERDVEAAACQLISSHPEIVALHPNHLEDIWRDIQHVGKALDVSVQADQLIASSQARIDKISQQAQAEPLVSVVQIEWIDPFMIAGNWMPELISIANGICLPPGHNRRGNRVGWDEICKADPDVIMIAPCGFEIARTQLEMETFSSKPGFADLRAAKQKRIAIADGNQFFNRPGPRVVESLEIVAEILHPSLFDFGHKGSGWVTFD